MVNVGDDFMRLHERYGYAEDAPGKNGKGWGAHFISEINATGAVLAGRRTVEATWSPLLDGLRGDARFEVAFREMPFAHLWDAAWWRENDPSFVVPDRRPRQPAGFPGIEGHEPDLARGHRERGAVGRAMRVIRRALPGQGTYANESDYFTEDWKREYWGANYERLLRIKRTVDPDNVFRRAPQRRQRRVTRP